VPGARKRNPVLVVAVVTPLVIAPFLLLGVYLGFYLGDSWGYSRTLLAIIFSAIGLLASFVVIVKLIGHIAAGDRATT
jgi:F0F1-type ATP synthase assembly protein I